MKKIIATAIEILNYRNILMINHSNMFWKLEIGSIDFKTRENLETVSHRLQLGTSS